jgi:hypothetical protein
MSVIGVELDPVDLVLTKGRDFRWTFENLDSSDLPVDFPSGTLYFEVATASPLTWTFTIVGSLASLKVESEVVNTVPSRTKWQLVFRPTGEVAGGDIVAYGTVRVQG